MGMASEKSGSTTRLNPDLIFIKAQLLATARADFASFVVKQWLPGNTGFTLAAGWRPVTILKIC
jgi:hypothetical protein